MMTGAENIQWDLSDLYASPQDPKIQADKDQLNADAEAFSEAYRGRVAGLSPGEFRDALQRYESILQIAHRLGTYASLLWSADTEAIAHGKLMQHIRELGSQINQRLVFFDVEWMAVNEDQALQLITSSELSRYSHYLTVSRLYKEHTLSEAAEQALSAKSVTGRSAWTRFFDETLSAARFAFDGEELTEQQVLSKLHNPEREIRKKAHTSLTDGFKAHMRTLTFIFNTVLADKASSDQLRKYPSWISARNLSNQTDNDTVNALVQTVTGSYPLVQRYYKLKADLLGLDTLYDYDRYAPLKKSETKLSWNEARQRVLNAYSAFHPDMGKIAGLFFEQNWIDAAIRPGKRGGAFSASSSTDTHPYVLMNYDGQLRDVQTLAHELGHGVHQYLSRQQGELQSGTPLTTAETASVFGEMLVFEDILSTLDDPSERLALLMGKIDDTIATVYRQISMNRFEDLIHMHRRESGELSSDEFSSYWIKTQEELYGDSVTLTPEYRHWWCYIPHFLHTPGYVYAYAFGELLVLALYRQYREQPNGFADKYLQLLSAGGSRWPHDLLNDFGLDIRDASFWQRGTEELDLLIQSAEEIAQHLKKT